MAIWSSLISVGSQGRIFQQQDKNRRIKQTGWLWLWCYADTISTSIHFLSDMAGLGCTMSISRNEIMSTSWSQELRKPLMDNLCKDQTLIKTHKTRFINFHQKSLKDPFKPPSLSLQLLYYILYMILSPKSWHPDGGSKGNVDLTEANHGTDHGAKLSTDGIGLPMMHP